ncbi:MAG: hypothetical protein R2697_10885 [Ilumatobacteraceae bacterium]
MPTWSSSTATTSHPPSRSGRRSRSAWNPPVIYERERGWFTTEPFSEPRCSPSGGIGLLQCVNVEHEVILILRWVDVERVTFKYGLGEDFINVPC